MDPEEDTGSDEPLIHQPDLKDDDPRNGLMCFLNADRECGPECMAYTTMPAEAVHLDVQQKHCVLLVGVNRLGRHTGVMAKLINDAVTHNRKMVADSARQAPTPPDPLGSRRS